MRALLNRLKEVLMPSPFDLDGASDSLPEYTHCLSEATRSLHADWHHPNGKAMTARGVETHRLLKTLVSVLSARSVSCAPPTHLRGMPVSADSTFFLQGLPEFFGLRQQVTAFVGAAESKRTVPMTPNTVLAAMLIAANPSQSVMHEPSFNPLAPL